MSSALTPMNARNGSEENFELRKGSWTFEEDSILMQYIASHGQGQWNMLAKYSGLKRSGRSCRLRWLNYLKPDIRRGNLTIQEQLLILELHSQFGNRWSKIAQHLPGRTDNEIKNYWRTRVQKQARQLKVDSDSKRFLEAVQYFWMPRLIEQMEQNTSPLLSSSSSRSSLEIQVPSAFSTFQPKKKQESVDQYYENHNLVTNFTPEKIISKNYPNDDMEGFRLDTMSGADTCDRFLPDSHMAEKDWVIDDMSSIVWDMDELW